MLPVSSLQSQAPIFNSKYKIEAAVESSRNDLNVDGLMDVNEILTKKPSKETLYLDPGPFSITLRDQEAMTTSQG